MLKKQIYSTNIELQQLYQSISIYDTFINNIVAIPYLLHKFSKRMSLKIYNSYCLNQAQCYLWQTTDTAKATIYLHILHYSKINSKNLVMCCSVYTQIDLSASLLASTNVNNFLISLDTYMCDIIHCKLCYQPKDHTQPNISVEISIL